MQCKVCLVHQDFRLQCKAYGLNFQTSTNQLFDKSTEFEAWNVAGIKPFLNALTLFPFRL
jgi:hypothetical protein